MACNNVFQVPSKETLKKVKKEDTKNTLCTELYGGNAFVKNSSQIFFLEASLSFWERHKATDAIQYLTCFLALQPPSAPPPSTSSRPPPSSID